jgi:hypothetical protein
MATANANAVAGDTVNIIAGVYGNNGERINPTNDGTAGNKITFKSYGGTVNITSAACNTSAEPAVNLNGDNYIVVDGINSTNCFHHLIITNASYNEIKNCVFDNNTVAGLFDWNHSMVDTNSQYNWIHNNTFSNGGSSNSGLDDIGTVLDVGTEGDAADHTWYNLFDNNVFFHGGHNTISVFSDYNTFRNNYIHNEAWTGNYGDRNLSTIAGSTANGRNIYEGNKWGYAWESVDDGAVGDMVITSPNNIIRYNSIYHSYGAGIAFAGYTGYSNATNNKVYNNTFFNNGLVNDSGQNDTAVRVTNEAGQTPSGNVFKNNLYYNHYQVYAGSSYASQTYANEFNGDVSGDPLFVNANTTPPADKTDATVPNLNLQSGSPAINQGGALTTVAVADTGSGTSLVVSDARYFQDGTFAPAGTLSADWIAIGTVSNTVQIASINYSTNTITLENTISRSDGESIWLYKKSDGSIVLYGTAPDAGAYEYVTGSSVPVLTSPIDNATGLLFPITFTWDAFTGAVEYELQVDNNSDFSSPEMDIFTADTTVEGDTTDGLLPGVHYYWRVRALR